jgi:hypothetical protein
MNVSAEYESRWVRHGGVQSNERWFQPALAQIDKVQVGGAQMAIMITAYQLQAETVVSSPKFGQLF